MRTLTNRIIGLVLALAMIAAFVLVPTPMDIKAEAATVPSTKLCDYIQDGATLHCWNWSIANVKANLGLIANMGYSAVQLSPMQELKEGTVNKPYDNWWAVYQPISFNMNKSQSHCVGTKDELIDLCNEAHKYNIKVIMDVVFNHTANNGANQLCPLVDPDFLNDPACWHDYSQNSSSYMDRYDVTQKCMAGLPDLNTANQKVQDKALALMKEYIDCGVDGFRFDAAKQIETPEDHYSYASDFWPTVINGSNSYAQSTRGISLHFYGELLENTDQGNGGQGTLPMSAYTKYMSVTESVWSNDVRYKLEAHSAAALRTSYFKAANADKLVLWAESHDTVGDGSSLWSNEYNLNKAWALVSSRAYTMALYFPRCLNITDLPLALEDPNAKPVNQEMGEIVKLGWSSDFTRAVNRFHNHFAGQGEYLTQDTSANLYYNERGNSGVIIVNFNDGGRDINLPVYAMQNGTYYDQLTGNKFTVSNGRIYGQMGDTGVAVVYNPTTTSCSHSSHGSDGYCYSCYTYVGHKSGTKCSTCGTASTRTIYFKNTSGWSTPYVYGWHDSSSAAVTSGWPGNKMTMVEGDIYKAEIPVTATNIIFNNNAGSQTANLVPSADNDTYDLSNGYWSTRGQVDLADNYYIFYTTNSGAYNGFDYRFVDNKVSVNFSETSYVWITDSNGVQYMTDGWQGEVTSTTLKTLDAITGVPDKLPVPAGTTVNFTMVPNANGTITLSYTTGGSSSGSSTRTVYFDNSSKNWSKVNIYAWSDATGNYTGEWPGTAMTSIGSKIYSYEVPTAATKVIFNNGSSQTNDLFIPTDGRNLYNGSSWSVYSGNSGSDPEPTTEYYLFGYINGANYACDEDYANMGEYKFVNNQLTVHFNMDSYVGIKTTGNADWYMTKEYVSGDYGTFYNTTTGASEKMLIPGGTDVTITLIPHSDGTLSLSYSTAECIHSYSEEITTAPTCTAEGLKTFTCSKCGDQYWVILGATGHSYTSKVTTAATCTKDGVKTFTCSACGNKYTEVIPATGHNYSNGKCTVCGAADANCSHSYTSKVTIAATCISTGVKTYTCSKCGDVYTESIAATGHNYVDIVVPPSCEMNGYTKHQCSFCGAWGLNTDPVNPTGHSFDSTGTCTACGYYNSNYAVSYYLFGWINGADYGCEGDWENMGQYKFVDGKLTVRFEDASYVGIKTTGNSKWYMVKAYTKDTTATFYTTDQGGCDKMYIPGNVEVTMTLTENADGTLTLSYDAGQCDHLYSSYVSTQPGCETQGVRTYTCGYCGYSYSEAIPADGHRYQNGYCTVCGGKDPSAANTEYYLFGYINGSDYGWKSDISNLGYYKFENDKLTVRFDEESYIAVKTGDNARFFMTNGDMGKASSVALTEFADPEAAGASLLWVPGGSPVSLTLSVNSNGRLVLSYTLNPSSCAHYTHGTDGICTACGTPVGHNYSNGVCVGCGAQDLSYNPYEYYLFGWINDANYGCEDDYANLGEYKFVNGKLTATFDSYSYIGIKEVNPNAKFGPEVVGWYMTEEYTEATTATFKKTTTGTSEKMFVPGGVQLTFTLVRNEDGSLTLSYVTGASQCAHSYTAKVTTAVTCTNPGVMTYTCSKCGSSYNESIPAAGHVFVRGTCTTCGAVDESTTLSHTYYLVGWINGADYGCESDYENNGIYKFVNGQLTAKFTQDSYVFVKTENNGKWLLADAYTETPICVMREGGSEKLFVPGGVQLIFNITENADGSVVVSYTESSVSSCDHSYTAEVTTAATCTASGVRTYTCSKCSHCYTQIIPATGHNFFGSSCTICGAADPNAGTSTGTAYYLVGYINGQDYGCEGDYQNMGQYKFVNGRLTAKFTQDSYIFVKTEGNGKWLLSGAYCEASTCTFTEGGSEKMFVPGGVQLTFTLAENADGSVTVVYTSGSTPASVVPTLTLKSPTLEFKDMITVNAFYTAENTQDVVEMGMITYTSKVSRWSVRSAEYVIPGATYNESTGRYYSSSQGIHAKYLADTLYLAVYAKLADGSYVYSKLAPYSPLTYANSQLKNSTDTKLKQLVVSMLNYGAEAQLFFGHNTGNLANASLTASQLALPEAYRADMVSSVPSASATKQGSFANNSGFSKRYPAISFEGAFCINYFFTPKYAPKDGITLYYWNAEDYNAVSVLTTSNATGTIKLEGSGTGEYRGDIVGISAKNLSEAVYVAAVYKNGSTTYTSGVLGYSIGAYCSSQASKDVEITALAKATAVYGYHAKQYFG